MDMQTIFYLAFGSSMVVTLIVIIIYYYNAKRKGKVEEPKFTMMDDD